MPGSEFARKKKKVEPLPDLPKGLYEARGQVCFIGYQTNFFVKLVEIYNPTDEPYAWEGMRHPAAGPYVRKTTPRRLPRSEITAEMILTWKARAEQAAGFITGATAASLGP